jgi:benzaldehyde dehydrogenase (NAD)
MLNNMSQGNIMASTNDTAANSVSRSVLSDPQLLYITGANVPSTHGTTFAVTNPMTGEDIYNCSSASLEDYKTAIESAHAAFKSWSQTPPSARRLILLKAADILETYLADDGQMNAPEILSSEVSATKGWIQVNIRASAGILRESAGLVTHIKGEVVPADRPGTTILVVREAVGVVFAISPWNAPVCQPCLVVCGC